MKALLTIAALCVTLISVGFLLGYQWSYIHLKPLIAKEFLEVYQEGYSDALQTCQVNIKDTL